MSEGIFLAIEFASIGLLVAFVALGYSLIYGVLRFVNFAHGEMLAFTAYIALSLQMMLANSSFVTGLMIAGAAGAVVGMLLERMVYRPFRRSGSQVLLLVSFAISMALQAVMSLTWGSASRVSPIKEPTLTFAGRVFPERLFFLLLLALLGFAGLEFALKKTLWGLTVRGYSANPVQVVAIGAPINRAIAVTFAVAGALAGVAGVCLGLQGGISPSMGFHFGLWAFAATVVGGLGSIRGTFVGGILLGGLLAASSRYFSVLYTDAVAFTTLSAVLIWKPTGLFAFLDREI
jgi:branched-chain amino acid transport system permease protein